MAEKRLTKEIAEQFLADDESVDLNKFTELDDDAAERLSKDKGGLILYGLTSLSDAAAASLGNYDGEWLDLNGLTSLSFAAAESLEKQHKEGSLSLDLDADTLPESFEILRWHLGYQDE